jgi:2-polyprenyl-3-methyl-5-hydroxy-6-metoxy-1,4-benzoquinol methylase
MRPVTSCLVCGGSDFRVLVKFKKDAYFQLLLPSLRDQPLRYVVCEGCGFVFQNPTLDDDELGKMYAQDYRAETPPDTYMSDQRHNGEVLYQWIDKRIGRSLSQRRLLDIGCAAGAWVAVFQRRGWEASGIDANPKWVRWGRANLGADLHDGFYGSQAFPEQTFSLILWSHIIEHLPDPLTMLQAIRDHLDDDGYLFIGTPDVLRPPVPRTYPDLLAGPHVGLYSARTLTRLLSRAGFTVRYLDHWAPRGLRVLASKRKDHERAPEGAADDYRVVTKLYAGLFIPREGDVFAGNLKACARGHPDLLAEIAIKGLFDRHRLDWKDGRVVNVTSLSLHGITTLLAAGESSRGGRMMEEASDRSAKGALVVQVGVGLGRHALSVAQRLDEFDQRLILVEPDAAILGAACLARDLSGLLASDRVAILCGKTIRLPAQCREWTEQASDIVVSADPDLHPGWRARYAPLERYFRTTGWRSRNLWGWQLQGVS